MGYYCTVPQCTSLAGKTKNVKFHRFPRDTAMADKWNNILKRGKPYTKYSKVCSLHFTQADYNVTTMGQWKTLSKDAVPSQNLPRLNPDGSVMVIRKSRTIKYKETRKEDNLEKMDSKWSLPAHSAHGLPMTEPCTSQEQLAYRLQTLGAIANSIQPQAISTHNLPNKPKKQDAFMQTDPILNEDDDTQPNNSYSEVSEKSYNSEIEQYGYQKDDFSKDYPKDSYPKEDGYSKNYAKETGYQKDNNYVKDSGYQKDTGYVKDTGYQKDAEFKDGSSKDKYTAKDYTKTADDYIPQTNEEYNKEAEKYFLDRTHNGFEKDTIYHKRVMNYPPDYYDKSYPVYSGYQDSADVLRNQQQNLHLLQDQSRLTENQNFFNENHIKQEIDINIEEEKFPYENRSKDQIDAAVYPERRRELGPQVKQEPETPAVCDVTMQPQSSPYYQPTAHNTVTGGYYDLFSRPGPELLIAKQNALAAHTELWQNMKRPFIYPDHVHYNPSQLLHNRYEV